MKSAFFGDSDRLPLSLSSSSLCVLPFLLPQPDPRCWLSFCSLADTSLALVTPAFFFFFFTPCSLTLADTLLNSFWGLSRTVSLLEDLTTLQFSEYWVFLRVLGMQAWTLQLNGNPQMTTHQTLDLLTAHSLLLYGDVTAGAGDLRWLPAIILRHNTNSTEYWES